MKTMKTRRAFLALAGAGALQITGCASIVSGHNQPLSVITPGCEKASCELENSKGKWFVPSTPGTVTVSRSYSDLQVKCNKDDAPAASASVRSATKAMAFGNIIFGGVIGAGVDMASGAAYDYPTEISVPMDCQTGTAAKAEASVASTPEGGIRLGCAVKNVDRDIALAAGLSEPTGVLITAVSPKGVADASELKVGDVLTTFNDAPVTDSAKLRDLLNGHPPGAPAAMRVFRDRQLIEVQLKLAAEGEV